MEASKPQGLRIREGWLPREKLRGCSQKKVEWIQRSTAIHYRNQEKHVKKGDGQRCQMTRSLKNKESEWTNAL